VGRSQVEDAAAAVVAIKHAEWARIVSGLIRVTGDWALAEDSAQDAFEVALQRWPTEGVPANPAAWVAVTARNRAIDRLRRQASESSKLRELAMMNELTIDVVPDDRLQLIFTCCHPALPLAARVALTLRTVAGLSTSETARAFLVPEPTMAQRLVRATRKIANAGIPYRVPPPELLDERLGGVLAVLYLLFNEGYSTGDRAELAVTAASLAESLVDLMPGENEPRGLLALMLLQGSRRDARFDEDGVPITIEDQDRGRWDRADIARGLALLGSTRPVEPYALQARIAACHANAASVGDTDWRSIVQLYARLSALDSSPVIALNRAIAVGMAQGPDAGLQLLAGVTNDGALDGYRLLPAARADLLRRAGRYSEAADFYREAIDLTPSGGERTFLERRLVEVEA
jgi:RNA polymerase sigma-70 factor (ECF subfamily)